MDGNTKKFRLFVHLQEVTVEIVNVCYPGKNAHKSAQ